jgi:hypothetical protein
VIKTIGPIALFDPIVLTGCNNSIFIIVVVSYINSKLQSGGKKSR